MADEHNRPPGSCFRSRTEGPSARLRPCPAGCLRRFGRRDEWEYEFEPDTKSEVMVDLYEYLLTSQLYHSFMDGAASEQSSRMAAMENATKNAGEMIDSLTLQYNRARQARITTELVEIISGAAALD